MIRTSSTVRGGAASRMSNCNIGCCTSQICARTRGWRQKGGNWRHRQCVNSVIFTLTVAGERNVLQGPERTEASFARETRRLEWPESQDDSACGGGTQSQLCLAACPCCHSRNRCRFLGARAICHETSNRRLRRDPEVG